MMAPIRLTDGVFFDLSSRVKLRVTGADRVRFLNGQITNDIRKASETRAIEACVLNTKGKMDAHFFVHANEDCFLIDADPALQTVLQARLERYIIADDVDIEDVTAKLAVFHVIGANVPELSVQARLVFADRFGCDGFDIWCEGSQHARINAELPRHFQHCDEDCAERLRIEKGIPRWGRELTSQIIPVEANLEQRCIDYEKGCYIGQETISRMKMSGQRNKQLCGLISLAGTAFTPGMRLISGSLEKDSGWITSATRSGGREIAIGYVKRGFNAVGAKLEAVSGENARVSTQVAGLPFSP
jgi:folate-binding protein YgfZ